MTLCRKFDLKPLKMITDVVTRWGSAHDMIQRGCYLRRAIDAFCKQEPKYRKFAVSAKEWTMIEFIHDILAPFKVCCKRLQTTTRPGIDMVFWAYETLCDELDALDEIAKDRYQTSHQLSE